MGINLKAVISQELDSIGLVETVKWCGNDAQKARKMVSGAQYTIRVPLTDHHLLLE